MTFPTPRFSSVSQKYSSIASEARYKGLSVQKPSLWHEMNMKGYVWCWQEKKKKHCCTKASWDLSLTPIQKMRTLHWKVKMRDWAVAEARRPGLHASGDWVPDQPDHDSKGHTMCCRYLDIYTSNFQPKSLFLPHLSKGRQKTGEPHLSALVVQTAGRWAFFSRTTVRGCSEEKKQTPKKSKVDIIMFHISLRDPIPFDSHSRGGREGNLTLPMSRNMAYHSHYNSCAWFISTTAHPEQHTSEWGQCK